MFEHVHVSNGVSKLGACIPSVNLPAVKTCRPDAPCFAKCYARKGRFSFAHNKELLEKNLRIWQNDPAGYERDVCIAAFRARFFRWHSAGDIVDAEYLNMMIRVAEALPGTKFLCFTKKYELVNNLLETRSLPDNLNIVFSAWGDWIPDNPYNLPVSYVVFKKGDTYAVPDSARQCPRYCGDCVMTGGSCWDLKRGESVVFHEH